jgi:hypothetical protein
LTACTGEIDDAASAVSEILGQLDIEGNLLKNSAGILTCYAEFIESGVVAELCRALPFEIVGSTTIASAVPGARGNMLLTLVVLTSDDVSFSVGLSGPLSSSGDESPLKEGYDAAVAKAGRPPSLMLSFAPLIMDVSCDFLVEALTRISGGVPNFGMVSVDHNRDYGESQVVFCGQAYADRYALLLVAGDISPNFYTSSISVERVFREKCQVTASKGNLIQMVDGMPVSDYLRKTIGLEVGDDGMIVGINTFSFIMDYNDGTKAVVRSVFAQTPEGYAVCGGDIPEGVTMSVGSIDADGVLSSAEELISSVVEREPNPSCLLMFSCVGRYFYLGYDDMAEMEKVGRFVEGTGIPYMLAYTGGEICPVYTKEADGAVANRSHNVTLVICALN